LVMSLATSWLSVPPAIKELSGPSDPMGRRRLNQNRKTLLESIARVVAPHFRQVIVIRLGPRFAETQARSR
jgi:hypothetical protein